MSDLQIILAIAGGFAGFVIGCWILYAIIRAGVRNGYLDARDAMRPRVRTPESVRMEREDEEIASSRKALAFVLLALIGVAAAVWFSQRP